MNAFIGDNDRIWYMADAVCMGTATDEELRELEARVLSDDTARSLYIAYCQLDAALDLELGGQRVGMLACDKIQIEMQTATANEFPVATPAPTFLSNAIHGTVGFFSNEVPFGFLTATLLTGLLLLGLWMMPVSKAPLRQIADSQQVSPSNVQTAEIEPAIASPTKSEIKNVGRITGKMDCVWSVKKASESKTNACTSADSPIAKALISFGDHLVVTSGLLEITYDTGAKVILEGPCTFNAETNGGFLAVGRLIGKMGKKASDGRWPVNNVKPQAAFSNQRSSICAPFVIATPTALITDLGTEFGVEVAQNGRTISHVFRGSVSVQLAASLSDFQKQDGSPKSILHENESACVEVKKDSQGRNLQPVLRRIATDPHVFTRNLSQSPQVVDLLDIVAGGFGVTGNRERGLDPTTGLEDCQFYVGWRSTVDTTYHRVHWTSNMIDGVFVLGSRSGSVTMDSAGHAFGGFPETDGKVYGSIWARAPIFQPSEHDNDNRWWVYAMGRGEKFMPQLRGLLCLHPNAGITFDLNVIRKEYPGFRIASFCATGGMSDATRFYKPADANKRQATDIWVFVDGQLRWKRLQQIHPSDGAIPIRVDFDENDHFLTLVTTDGGNGTFYDWVVYGDPVLKLVPNEKKEKRQHVENIDKI